MAGTVHQRWGLKVVSSSAEEEDRGSELNKSRHRCYALPWCYYRNRKVPPPYPDSQHTLSTESLWIDGCYSPLWINDELRRRSRLPALTRAQHGELCEKKENVIQDKALHDEITAFITLTRACAKNRDLKKGTMLHDDISKRGMLDWCSDSLVTMYAKCGAVAKAQELLDTQRCRDVFSWTALISAYARHGHSQDALHCFERMQHEGLSPDAVTFSCVLKACGHVKAADLGKQIHDEITRQGLLANDVVLGTALVDMYVKCGALAKAQCVLEELPFRNVVSWSALIAGYAQHGQANQALNCFEQMQHEGLSPDAVTFACVLKACGTIGALNKGVQVHDEIARQGLLGNNMVLGTALLDMYIKCGDLAKARQVLEGLPSRDVVTWSALIAGYAQQGQGEQALDCFERMQHEGLSPDAVTFAFILKACGTLGAADKGKQIHEEIAKQGLLSNNNMLGTALVDMYAKCGALAKAQEVLEEMPCRDGVSWSALISGYAQQGEAEQVLNCFERMQGEGFPPDAVTFSCVLNACTHLGLEEDGHMYFVNMSTKFGMKPSLEHFTCMVDLFGRAGHLDKAVSVIQEMPSLEHSAVWFALLGACQKWGDLNVGRWAFEQAIEVDKTNGAPYVLMANIYAAVGMQEDAASVETMRKENKAWKKPGHSWWNDMSGIAHAFFGVDTKHVHSNKGA